MVKYSKYILLFFYRINTTSSLSVVILLFNTKQNFLHLSNCSLLPIKKSFPISPQPLFLPASDCFLGCAKDFWFLKFHLLIFYFASYALVVLTPQKKSLLIPMAWSITLMFSSSHFKSSALHLSLELFLSFFFCIWDKDLVSFFSIWTTNFPRITYLKYCAIFNVCS